MLQKSLSTDLRGKTALTFANIVQIQIGAKV